MRKLFFMLAAAATVAGCGGKEEVSPLVGTWDATQRYYEVKVTETNPPEALAAMQAEHDKTMTTPMTGGTAITLNEGGLGTCYIYDTGEDGLGTTHLTFNWKVVEGKLAFESTDGGSIGGSKPFKYDGTGTWQVEGPAADGTVTVSTLHYATESTPIYNSPLPGVEPDPNAVDNWTEKRIHRYTFVQR